MPEKVIVVPSTTDDATGFKVKIGWESTDGVDIEDKRISATTKKSRIDLFNMELVNYLQ